jgi:hypothetical protein
VWAEGFVSTSCMGMGKSRLEGSLGALALAVMAGGAVYERRAAYSLGRGPGGTGLSGVPLGGAQVDDSLGQGRELEDEP